MISIIIPTYKREEKLNKSLKKIISLDSGIFKYEIIVINDAEEKIKIINDKRIKLIEHLKNKGGQFARKTGLKQAKFQWILFLDDDDEICSNFFNIISTIDFNSSIDIIYFDFLIQQSNLKFKNLHFNEKHAKKPWLQNTLFQNKIYNRNILDINFFSDIKMYQDENIFFKSVNKKTKYKIINKPIIKYKYNENSVSKFNDYLLKFNRLLDNYLEFVNMPETEMTLYARGRLFSFLKYWTKLGKLNKKELIKNQKKIKMKFTLDDIGRLILSKIIFWK